MTAIHRRHEVAHGIRTATTSTTQPVVSWRSAGSGSVATAECSTKRSKFQSAASWLLLIVHKTQTLACS